MPFKLPPVLHNQNGELRKVGLELEYGKLGIDESVQIIRELYGGIEEKEHRFARKVKGTRLGDFSVEIDLRLLTEKKYKYIFDTLGVDLKAIKLREADLEEEMETALENIINKFIPYEIGSPPLPITELEELEALRQALYEHHAEGTEAFPTNAFGLHINPEVPDTSVATILNYLRAFLLLYLWLLENGHTDFMRQNLTSFINPYPEEYTELVLDENYHPDLDTFIDDYHLYSPNRNRPLDLYPLLAALRKEKITAFPDLGKVKPRETFHYRLPNSWVSRPDWSLAQEWNHWVVVEELANDTEKLQDMSRHYLQLKEHTLLGFEGKWTEETEKWLS
jgi:hypothetical protein